MDKQTIDHMKGEIRFREKLVDQHVKGEELVDGYIKKDDHDEVMRERVDTTRKAMKQLQAEGVGLSPFIEVGAERGHRSMVMVNDFGTEGFAVDLSFAQLKTLDYWMKFFDMPKAPVRVCCDVYHLPFQSGSLGFSFCYQFLHHFPGPGPVLKEIHRVLSGGYFFFDEEPYKRYSLKLYRRKVGNTPGTIKKYLRYLESFIAEQYETEEEYGIIENDDIPLSEWLESVEIFDGKRIFLQSASLFRSEMGKVSRFKVRLHKMLGGGISGLVKKEPSIPGASYGSEGLYDLLGCPVCVIEDSDTGRDRGPLVKHSDHLKCDSCNVEYPIVENVLILLPISEMKELYPKFVR
ncbi:MAG: methyltransferase domain-containing protein [bacterium]|nr:methyltransferase domain-containing protein [bacterium]